MLWINEGINYWSIIFQKLLVPYWYLGKFLKISYNGFFFNGKRGSIFERLLG